SALLRTMISTTIGTRNKMPPATVVLRKWRKPFIVRRIPLPPRKALPRPGSLMFRSYYETKRPYRQHGASEDHNGERGRDSSATSHRNQNECFLSHIEVLEG